MSVLEIVLVCAVCGVGTAAAQVAVDLVRRPSATPRHARDTDTAVASRSESEEVGRELR